MIIDSFVLFFTHARQQKKEAQAEHLPTAIIRAKSKKHGSHNTLLKNDLIASALSHKLKNYTPQLSTLASTTTTQLHTICCECQMCISI